ncbi:MAG: glycosyltransferase [Pyrinomonadaceae bacterium]
MRILFLAPKECWPPTTGAMLRNYHLAREVARAARVTFLSFGDGAGAPHDGGLTAGGLESPAVWCERVIEVPRRQGYTPSKLLRGALGSRPVTVLNYTTPEMRRALERALEEGGFDLVQVESIHLSAYLPLLRAAKGRPPVVLDWHNVESEVMTRYAARAGGALRRAYARRTARQLARLETRALRDFDAHLTVSERDRAQLLALDAGAPAYVVENGVAAAHFADQGSAPEGAPRRILFVGSMDYHANVDAVVAFAREAWPLLAESLPSLTFSIVGREPAAEVRELSALPRVEVSGTVEDVRPFYRGALASVVPLRVGGGSRLKILEAMAAGVPVVSTRLGAEGIEARDGAEIMLAETAVEFREALARLASDDGLRRDIAAAAREFVRSRYDWSSVGAGLLKIYEGLLGAEGGVRAAAASGGRDTRG